MAGRRAGFRSTTVRGQDANLMGCESIGVDPTDPKRVYMAAAPTRSRGPAMAPSSVRRTRQDLAPDRHALQDGWQRGGPVDWRAAGRRSLREQQTLFRLAPRWALEELQLRGDVVARKVFSRIGRTNGVGIGSWCSIRRARPAAAPRAACSMRAWAPNYGLYRSSDSGATWARVEGQPAGLLPHQTAFDGQANSTSRSATRPVPTA